MNASKVYICFFINLIISVNTFFIVLRDIPRDRKEKGNPVFQFRYFTVLSNIYAAVSCLLSLLFEIPMFSARSEGLPKWLLLLVFSSAGAVLVTFMTVMVFLGPTKGYKDLLTKGGFHFHLLNPLLAAFCCVIEAKGRVGFGASVTVLIPVLLYGALYCKKVLILTEQNGGWPDFYGFNRDGKWKISLAAMITGAVLIGIVLWLLCR